MDERFQRVMVYGRVCPHTHARTHIEDGPVESPDDVGDAVTVSDGKSIHVSNGRDRGATRSYAYEGVFDPSSPQVSVYTAVAASVVRDVLDSWNGCVLAYGQTGSGKTYTMCGPRLALQDDACSAALPAGSCVCAGVCVCAQRSSLDTLDKLVETDGIIPRAVVQVFEAMAAAPPGSMTVEVAFLQLYCECLQDLLWAHAQTLAAATTGAKNGAAAVPATPETSLSASLLLAEPPALSIREDPKEGVFVEGLTWVPVTSPAAALACVCVGAQARATASTRMNAHSSRSHAVFMLRVTRRTKLASMGPEQAGQRGASLVQRGILHLVDLAGSERAHKSGAINNAALMNELKAINLSLSALGNVIAALAANARTARSGSTPSAPRFVPYRDSKLTRLLQDCLGGNARTSLIVTVSPDPASVGETQSTLDFGARASKVAVHPRKNQRVDYRALYLALKAQMDGGAPMPPEMLGDAAAEADDGDVERDDEELRKLREENAALRQEIDDLRKDLDAAKAAAFTAKEERAASLAMLHALSRALPGPGVERSSDVPGGAVATPSTDDAHISERAALLAPEAAAALTAAQATWTAELSRLRAAHASELLAMRRDCDAKVSAATAAQTAAEVQREEARDELLDVLMQYRTARERVREVERDTVTSLADAVAEVEASRLREEQLTRANEELGAALARATDTIETFRRETDGKPTPTEAAIAELHALYGATIDMLQQRVDQLARARNVTLEDQLQQHAVDTLKHVPAGVLTPPESSGKSAVRSGPAAPRDPARAGGSVSQGASIAAGSGAHAAAALAARSKPVMSAGAATSSAPLVKTVAEVLPGLHLPSLAIGTPPAATTHGRPTTGGRGRGTSAGVAPGISGRPAGLSAGARRP